jgi:hypothetical protein
VLSCNPQYRGIQRAPEMALATPRFVARRPAKELAKSSLFNFIYHLRQIEAATGGE